MISSRCSICQSESVEEINREVAEGGNLARIAEHYSVPYHALYSHARNHVPSSESRKQLEEKQSMLANMDSNIHSLEEMLRVAKEKKNTDQALKIMTELRACNQQRMSLATVVEQAMTARAKFIMDRQSANDQEQENNISFDERIKVLNTPELLMLERLLLKIETQNSDMYILPDHNGIPATMGRLR